MYWEPMRENQRTSREAFEIKLVEAIHDYWLPGPRRQSGTIALVDFSTEGFICLQLYVKDKGDKSDIVASGENRQLLRQQRMWADIRVKEIYSVKHSELSLIKDPFHSYTVYSTNHEQTFRIPLKGERLSLIKWMYQEEHPYIT
jgi:hypothetical protein